MKKLAFIAAGLACLILASCKKDRTCECTKTTTLTTPTSTTIATDPLETIEIKNINKKEAESLCQKSTSVTVNGNVTNTEVSDCKLK